MNTSENPNGAATIHQNAMLPVNNTSIVVRKIKASKSRLSGFKIDMLRLDVEEVSIWT